MTDSLLFLDLGEALKLEPLNDAVKSELAKLNEPESKPKKLGVIQPPTSPTASSSVRSSLVVQCSL